MKPEDFYTRSKANEGARMYLPLPDGTMSEHYLTVRSTDCDAYRTRLNNAVRDSARNNEMTAEEKAAEKDRVAMDLLVSLVAGWSFEKEASEANIREFLTECPNIADRVDRFSVQRANFFKREQTS